MEKRKSDHSLTDIMIWKRNNDEDYVLSKDTNPRDYDN